MRKYLIIALLFPLFMLHACGNQEGTKTSNNTAADSMAEQDKSEARDSVRILTLPTPMMIPALMKNSDIPYAPDRMLTIHRSDKTYFKSSILFGVYMMDMSYAASYSHQQASLDYFEACRDIANDLGLGVTMPEALLRRFKGNVNAPDSLGRIILKVYDGGHELLINQNKEGMGLLMVAGCFMEGLHLNLDRVRPNNLLMFVHLLNQNKQHGVNLRWMLEEYEVPDEVRVPMGHFLDVVGTLETMDIPTIYDLKSGNKSISSIKKEDLEKIQNSVADFRQSISQ